MRNTLLASSLLILAVSGTGCDDHNDPSVSIKQINSSPRVREFTYKGNAYLIVDDTTGISICPALPPKVEKDARE